MPYISPRIEEDFRRQAATATAAIRELQIRPAAIDQTTFHLSGCNQQKVVLAKWLAMQPRMVILDEPTRGIDVGAKTELYERIVALAHAGLTILMVSSDLEEVLGLRDRVILMSDRCITAVLAREKQSC